jgi:hypothetical protein
MAPIDFTNEILNLFPLPGLWETASFLTILVAIRIFIYAVTAKEEPKHHFYIGSFLLYALVLAFFGEVGLIGVLIVHSISVVFRNRGGRVPVVDDIFDRAKGFKDVSTFTVAALALMILQYVQYLIPASKESLNALPSLVAKLFPGEILLIILLGGFLFTSSKKNEHFSADLGKIIFWFVTILVLVGVDALLWYIGFLTVRPLFDAALRGFKQQKQFDGNSPELEELEALQDAQDNDHGSMTVLGKYLAASIRETNRSISNLARTITQKEEEGEHGGTRSKSFSIFAFVKALFKWEFMDYLNSLGDGEADDDEEETDDDEERETSGHTSMLFLGLLLILAYVGDLTLPWMVAIIIDVALAIYLYFTLGKVGARTVNKVLVLAALAVNVFYSNLIPTFLIVFFIIGAFHLGPKGRSSVGTVAVILVLILVLAPMLNLNLASSVAAAKNNSWFSNISLFSIQGLSNIPGPRDIVDYFKREIFDPLTKPYYISEVESSVASENIGVQLNIRPLGSNLFYSGHSGRISADIAGELVKPLMRECFLNKTLPKCQVITSCSLKGYGRSLTSPRILSFADFAGSKGRIDCDFTPVQSGSKEINFEVEFDFETSSYVPFYAIQEERYNSKRADGETDLAILSEYGFPVPVSKRTPGPVEVGIGLDEGFLYPVPTIPKEARPLPFGFTIRENTRYGEISEIKDAKLYIPEGFVINNCAYPFDFKEEEQSQEGEKIYSLSRSVTGTQITDFLTVTCWLTPNKGSSEIVSGGGVPTAKWFRVSVNTRNKIKRSTFVNVKAIDADDGSTYSSSKARDFCPEDVSKCSEYPDKDFCDVDGCFYNCAYSYAGTNECHSCSEYSTCSDYEGGHQCTLDPCQIGCSWQETAEKCEVINMETKFIWPMKTSQKQVTCDEGDDRIVLFTQTGEIIAPISGTLLTGTESSMTIANDPYKITFFQPEIVTRERGNVFRGQVIGKASKDTKFEITLHGERQNLFDFYAKQDPKVTLLSNDPGCGGSI